jgi:hypothetical protein
LPEPPAALPGDGWSDPDHGREARRRRRRGDAEADADGFWPERWRD